MIKNDWFDLTFEREYQNIIEPYLNHSQLIKNYKSGKFDK